MQKRYVAPIPQFVNITDELAPGVFVIDRMPRREVVRDWTKQITGKVWISDDSFTHASGHCVEVYVLGNRKRAGGEIDDQIPKLMTAREVTQNLTGIENVGWTYGKLARTITEWLGIKQMPYDRARALVPNWHYQRVKSGIYPDATMYDLTAAYWQVAAACESPRFQLSKHKIIWQPLSVEQRRRWYRLLKVFEDPLLHKRLRVTLVGANAAGWSNMRENMRGTDCFYQGALQPWKNKVGDLQPMALLAVRCTYEVTQIQSEMSNSVYSNADCFVTESKEPPAYWDQLGLIYRPKAGGMTIVRDINAYMCGNKATGPYAKAEKFNIFVRPIDGKRVTGPLWHTQVFKGK